jgi:hypothetical protein
MSPAAVITVTSGPKNAVTDPETGLRYYVWKGQRYPSVSSLRRMAGLSFTLHQWTLSRVIDRAVGEHEILTRILERPARPRERVRDKNVQLEARRWLRSAATEERDAAAELGTAVHTAVLADQHPNDVSEDVRPYLHQYRSWLHDSQAEVHAVEKQVFNLTEGYAGSFDLLVRFPRGDVYVIDIKTSRGTYTDHALQLVGYSQAEFSGEDDVIDQRVTDLLASATGMALLHLTPDGWTFQRVRVTPRLFGAFRGLLNFSTFMAENLSIDGLIQGEIKGGVGIP